MLFGGVSVAPALPRLTLRNAPPARPVVPEGGTLEQMAAPPSFDPLYPPTSHQPPASHQAPLGQPPPKRAFGLPVVIGVGAGGFVAGIGVGVLVSWLLLPSLVAGPEPAPSASASAVETATAEPEPTASATEEPAAPPAIDPAAAAHARKLAELRKKVKGARAKQLDAQCKRFKSSLPVGYVYDGGTFNENEFVANSAGCVALAKASKAPWFCCRK